MRRSSRSGVFAFIGLLITAGACSSEGESTVPVELSEDGGWYDSFWVSPDGQRALYMYSRYNFFPAILQGKAPQLEGIAPPGHNPNDINPWNDSDLYMMTRQADGLWGAPVNLEINNGISDCCAMMAGNEMFYQKGTDLYIAVQNESGWSAPEKIAVSEGGVDGNPHYDMEGEVLYWASDRGGNLDIWQARRTGFNEWGEPRPVPGGVNTEAAEDQPFVSRREMRFSRDSEFGNMRAVRENGQWSAGEPEPLGTNLYHAEIALSADGSTAWFTAGDISQNRLVFMKTQRQPDGTWGPAEEIKRARNGQ